MKLGVVSPKGRLANIVVAYAHEPEVKELKRLVAETPPQGHITWSRWRGPEDSVVGADSVPELLVNCGFAGRLNKRLNLGDVVLVKDFACARAQRFARRAGVELVSLTTAEAPVVDREIRDILRLKTGADVVDMEARRLFASAVPAGVDFVSFKVISDFADSDAWDLAKRNEDRWARQLAAVVFLFLGFWIDERHGHNSCLQPGIAP